MQTHAIRMPRARMNLYTIVFMMVDIISHRVGFVLVKTVLARHRFSIPAGPLVFVTFRTELNGIKNAQPDTASLHFDRTGHASMPRAAAGCYWG